ncbi:uncharacterized protein PG986_002177 [Apiospora aurea]|uniref:Ankyrin n=1 Tax=Apiospora aurea TaxID=335848 RepID=A0ABR1QYZ1_9PEZI
MLKAVLRYQAADIVKKAMETTDAEGHTPFSRSLLEQTRSPKEKYLESVVILIEYIEFSSAMTQSPESVLFLAVRANSEQVFDFLIDSNMNIQSLDSDGNCPLHYLSHLATEHFVSRLKLLHQGACNSHGSNGPPLQSYLRNCLIRLNHTVNKVIIEQLYTKDIPPFSLWEEYTATYKAISTARVVKDTVLGDTGTSAGAALVQLGYLASYESQNKRSGLFPLLDNIPPENCRWICPLIRLVAGETSYWSEFRKSDPAVRLLKLAVRFMDLDFLKWLLSQGVNIHDRVEGYSALEDLVRNTPHDPQIRPQMFNLVVEHADRYRINETGPDGLALVHQFRHSCNGWMIEPLARLGMDLNLSVQKSARNPALVHHLMKRHFEYASALLSSGADPCRSNRRGWNAVLAASAVGATGCLEEIYCADEIEKKIDWSKTCTDYYYSPEKVQCGGMNGLHLAASAGHVAILKFYIKHGLLQDLDSANDLGLRPLHLATAEGHLGVIKFLHCEGCDINAKSEDGSTALHLAAKYGFYEIANYLIQSGCEPSLDDAGWSPLLYAHQSNNKEVAEYLESIGSNSMKGAGNGMLPLGVASTLRAKATANAFEVAICQNNLAMCQALYNNHCDLDSYLFSCGGCSPLIKAILDHRPEIVEWLLRENASMARTACHLPDFPKAIHLLIGNPTLSEFLPGGLQNYRQQGGAFLGEFPGLIHAALLTHDINTLRLLLDHLKQNKHHYAKVNNTHVENVLSVAVNEPNMNGEAPIHLAAVQIGDLDAIDLLLDMGADINARDHWLNTPLVATIQYGTVNKLKVATHLIAKGACVERRGSNNHTALMEACSQGLPDVVEELLDAHDNTAVMDQDQFSLLHFTMDPRTFAILVQKGLDIHSLKFDGWSGLHLAVFEPSYTSSLLNMDIRLEDSNPIQWAGINLTALPGSLGFLRLARRKYRREALEMFINLSPCNSWSPLSLAAASGSVAIMDSLLSLGAPLDSNGCPLGSALMAAGEAGQEDSVIFLVRRGAALTYSGSSGPRSVFVAAQKFPDVLNWLLVGRFMDQAKLAAATTFPDGLEDGDKYDRLYTWGGPIKAELIITGIKERHPQESSFEYWCRLMRIKKCWRGRVVMLTPGMRTTRPSNLVPREYVRIHPDGYEVRR